MCLNVSNVLRSINRALFSFSCIGSDRNGLNGLENSLGAGGSLLTEVNDLGEGGGGVSATAVLGQPPRKLDASRRARVEIVNGPVRDGSRDLKHRLGEGKVMSGGRRSMIENCDQCKIQLLINNY